MWLKKIFRKEHPREVKSVTLGLNDEMSKFIQFGLSAETATNALNLYNESTAVSIPINKIAKPFANLDLVLKTGDEILKDHPVLELLKQPSPYYTQGLFLEVLAKDYLVTNESHIVAIGNINRPPLELQPISPSNISIDEGMGGTPNSIIVAGSTLPGSYLPDNRKKNVRYYNGGLREAYYIRGYSTRNNSLLRGQSLLVSASKEARQHILGSNHNVSILEKGGRISLVFHFEEDVGVDDLKAIKQRINEEYSGANKAGTIGVTSGGKLDIQELSKNNKDMEFTNLQQMAKFAVASQYDLPLALITTDAQTFDNFKEAKLALYDDAILPLANRLLDGLSAFLLPRYGIDPTKTRITYDVDTITALVMRRNSELKLLKELDIFNDNELRGRIAGVEDYEGGDIHYKPANFIPVGSSMLNPGEPRVVRNNGDDNSE